MAAIAAIAAIAIATATATATATAIAIAIAIATAATTTTTTTSTTAATTTTTTTTIPGRRQWGLVSSLARNHTERNSSRANAAFGLVRSCTTALRVFQAATKRGGAEVLSCLPHPLSPSLQVKALLHRAVPAPTPRRLRAAAGCLVGSHEASSSARVACCQRDCAIAAKRSLGRV